MKKEVYKRQVDTPDELLARFLDAAASTKTREAQLNTNNTPSSHTGCQIL
jgi:hypothetical protein